MMERFLSATKYIFTSNKYLNRVHNLLAMPNGKESSDKRSSGEQDGSYDKISREEWKGRLTPLEYDVTRNAATERPFSSDLCTLKKPGIYSCTCCGTHLFSSSTKFDSGCGWPAFSSAIEEGNIVTRPDTSLDMIRTEVICKRCNAHLGHVFDDGPPPTRLRYCINGVALKFAEAQQNA